MVNRTVYFDLLGYSTLLSVANEKHASTIIMTSICAALIIRGLVLLFDRNAWKDWCNRDYIERQILKYRDKG